MSVYLPEELRHQLEEVDDHRCAYCQTLQANSGQRMVPDHIVPQSKGGETVFTNLCYSCRLCNEFKGPFTAWTDPLTGQTVSLFHPRQQNWLDHFAWDESGVRVVGLTAVGRATIVRLQMNHEVILPARRKWVSAGWHPPQPK
ncbi:MAG TPA: HNH endonuclease [Chloroflexota bacterium]|nr:HNH endonuclease [Chloroflexota bacterium]HUM71169.1 HNH endonuclease [Chloroflexota bacterium]